MNGMSTVNMVKKHIDEHICVCRTCSGTGRVDGEECRVCNGTGRVVVSSDITTYVRPFEPEH